MYIYYSKKTYGSPRMPRRPRRLRRPRGPVASNSLSETRLSRLTSSQLTRQNCFKDASHQLRKPQHLKLAGKSSKSPNLTPLYFESNLVVWVQITLAHKCSVPKPTRQCKITKPRSNSSNVSKLGQFLKYRTVSRGTATLEAISVRNHMLFVSQRLRI